LTAFSVKTAEHGQAIRAGQRCDKWFHVKSLFFK